MLQKLRVSRTHSVEGHPYLRLLRKYLEEFLPRDEGEDTLAAPAAGATQHIMSRACYGARLSVDAQCEKL